MSVPKKYFHDHYILLLLSINTFLVFVAVVIVLWRLSAGHGTGYIVQYRADLGINAFKTGSVTELLGFIGFALMVFGIHTVLSLRTYRIHRQLSTAILMLGILLLVLTIIISNALLVLH
ncbi:MAG TPA: hypothetical protein VNE40_04915 [Candidatus Dormibacteraeota bacterium]|nr:hypothetical protein [Candidatus Dormibacteraeota bacterium]